MDLFKLHISVLKYGEFNGMNPRGYFNYYAYSLYDSCLHIIMCSNFATCRFILLNSCLLSPRRGNSTDLRVITLESINQLQHNHECWRNPDLHISLYCLVKIVLVEHLGGNVLVNRSSIRCNQYNSHHRFLAWFLSMPEWFAFYRCRTVYHKEPS